MNEFERLLEYLLNKPWYLIWFFIFLWIINLSNLITAYRNIKSFFIDKLDWKNSHTFNFDWETTSYEIMLTSKKFDIVKINATTHFLGVGTEHLWIEKYYWDAVKECQILEEIELEWWEIKSFDIIPIRFKNIKKDIYFDISSFLNEQWSSETEWNEFVKSKIRDLYN